MEGFGAFIAEFGGWSEIGAGAFVAFIIFLILNGKLVPASQVARIENDRMEWKEVAMKGVTVSQVQSETGEKLMELAETLEHFLESLPSAEEAQKEIEAGEEKDV